MNTENSIISNITLNSSNKIGIGLYYSRNNSITGNSANNNNINGIYLLYSCNNSITGNTASGNNEGISLVRSSNNSLFYKIMYGNNYNIVVNGGRPSHFIQKIDTSNHVSGKPVYYWVDQQDSQVPDDAGFVGIINSTNITVRNLTITNNSIGVLFVYTNNSRIENVTTSDNYYAIYLHSSSNDNIADNTALENYNCILLYSSCNNNNIITGNTASGNDNGISLRYSSNNSISGNTVTSNKNYGICLSYSSKNNYIYNNYFNSTSNAYCAGKNNTWNITKTEGTNIIDGLYLGENYGSDYAGEDLDGDGLGDTMLPYDPSGKFAGGDYLPLVKASTPSDFDIDKDI